MSTNEFISRLEARGVKVLFNQASTGYVSGISYSYQGMVMQGSKLGNGFKWSTIKNAINYEQERDRQRIYQTNVRSEHAINQLRAGNNHARGNTANTQGSIDLGPSNQSPADDAMKRRRKEEEKEKGVEVVRNCKILVG